MSSLAANVRAVLQADFGTLGGGGPLNIQVLQYQICRGAFAVAQKLDDPELAPLRVELLCKLMLPPRREPLAFDKFILVVPFYVLWAFPLSFYARAHLQSTSSSSSAETKRCAQLMGRPKLCLRVDWQIKIPDAFNLEKRGDLSNHQNISFVEFLAWNHPQMKFYKDINSQYRCAVDVGIMASAFDDFLIQNQLNLYNVLDLSNILDPSVAAKFTFSYTRHALVRPDQIDRQVAFGDAHARRLVSDLAPQILVIEVNQRSKPGQARLTASGQLETLEQAHERTYRELFDLWTRLVRPALRTDGSAYTLADFDLATAAFDIEVGYTQSLGGLSRDQVPAAKKTLPSFLDGFCQCICLKTAVCRGCILPDTARTFQFVYLPPYLKCSSDEFVKKWHEQISSRAYWFKGTLVYTDILVGFNSKNFDLPYLVMRYNALMAESFDHVLTAKYLGYFSLDSARRFSASVDNVKVAKMEIRCAACTARFNIYKVAAFNGKRECTSCQTPIGYIDPETVSVTLTSRYVAAQDGSGGPSAGFERMPFMFHYDIMTSKFSQGCEQHNLDAVAAAAFACGVETITTPGDSANIVLRTSSVRGRAAAKIFLGSFMLGINIVVFYKQKLSNATCQQLSGRLDGIWWSSVADRKDGKAPTKLIFDLSGELDDLFEEATTGEVDFFLEITNIVGVVPSDFTKTKYLVSVAKTCTISREDQLWWRNTDDALATVFYCHVDTLLTFGIEEKTTDTLEMQSCPFMEIEPFKMLNTPSGRKIMPKLTRLIIKDCFLVPMTNPRQLSDFFDFALEVEGVKAEIPVEQTTGVRGVYTLPAYEFAGDLMRNDKPNTFVNEWYLGTMGEFAMDDLGKLDASLRNLSS